MLTIMLLGIAVSTSTIMAQSSVCEPQYLKHSRQGELGYRQRAPDRCEGFFWDKKVAGEFEVISFLYGALAFDWRENVVLDVVFPDSDWDFNRNPVHVVAVPRSLEGYYRLDGRSPMAWPIADVIYPKRLSAGKLGIYGRLESENIFVPLLVGQRGASLEGKNLQPPRLGIRSPIPIENVFWQWGFHINGNCSNYSESNRIVNPRLHDTDSQYQFDIGEVFFFHLPVVTGEKLCIKILGQEQQSGSKKPFLIKVYLPKNNND